MFIYNEREKEKEKNLPGNNSVIISIRFTHVQFFFARHKEHVYSKKYIYVYR